MDTGIVQIIALVGWLILAGSALASFRLSWKKGVQLGLMWFAIFGFVFLVFSWAGS